MCFITSSNGRDAVRLPCSRSSAELSLRWLGVTCWPWLRHQDKHAKRVNRCRRFLRGWAQYPATSVGKECRSPPPETDAKSTVRPEEQKELQAIPPLVIKIHHDMQKRRMSKICASPTQEDMFPTSHHETTRRVSSLLETAWVCQKRKENASVSIWTFSIRIAS